MRILVTDGHYKHALGIVRALGEQHEVFVAAPRRLAMGGVSRLARRLLLAPPSADQERFLAWLDRTVPRHRLELVMPVGAAACELLSLHRRRWEPATRVVVAEPEPMRRALDKRASLALAAELGLNVPATVQPRALDEVDAAADEVGVPLVIKAPLEGRAGVSYVTRREEVVEAVAAYRARHRLPEGQLPLLQRRIVGPAFGVFATYQDGRCRRVMAHRRVREHPPSGGESSCCEVVHDPELFEIGRRLLDALGWHGVAMVELKRHDADGRYYLMEVNPKFWGSLDLALAAGAEFPRDLVRIAAGEQLPTFEPPPAGLRLCWPLSSDLRHLAARPGAWRSVVRDWLGGARTNVRASDPLPHLVELAGTVGHLARGGDRAA